MRILLAFLFSLSAQAAPNWNVYRNYPYGPDPAEVADLYLLKGSGHPAVIFIHGGAWAGGDKSTYAGYYAEKYGNAGYSVISINYRLADVKKPGTQWPAQLQDVQLAVRWVRHFSAQLGIDPSRICAFGDSAGAHLALFLGLLKTSRPGDRSASFSEQSPAVSCVVDMFGPADLTRPDQLKALDGLALFGGRKYAEAPAAYQDASPIRYVGPQSAPVFIIQGTTDDIVPFASSQALLQALTKSGVRAYFQPFAGGHWFVGAPSGQKTQADNNALAFVRMFLH